MGMFDSVMVKCPNCGKTIELQSKSGDCLLEAYPIESAPIEILSDISDDQICPECMAEFNIKNMRPKTPDTIKENIAKHRKYAMSIMQAQGYWDMDFTKNCREYYEGYLVALSDIENFITKQE